jgi:hypothetical protein
MSLSAGRRRLFSTAVVAVAVAVVEAGSWAALRLLERRGLAYEPVRVDELKPVHRQILEDLLAGRPGLLQHDADLGWSPRPGFRSERYAVNNAGVRADRDHSPGPEADRLRLAAFGDSFTFGMDVADAFAYPEQLARLDPALEVWNFGVPGYGLDQALLRYEKEGRKRRPRVVVIGFMSENVFRVVSVFRPFYLASSELPLAKPRFVPRDGGLSLIPNPLPRLEDYRNLLERPREVLERLGQHDLHFRTRMHAGPLDALATVRLAKLARETLLPPTEVVRKGAYNVEGEAFQVTVRLFASFYRTVTQDGAEPVILLFPDRSDIERHRRDGTTQYRPLLEFLEAGGYRFVDAMDALKTRGAVHAVSELAPSHYSPLGNRLVAEHLLERLRGYGLLGTAKRAGS